LRDAGRELNPDQQAKVASMPALAERISSNT
jgi:hypothetical protein